MRILSLDLGDVWTGTALSDPLKIIARPYQSLKSIDLIPFLHNLFQKEAIDTIVVGYPRTMKGTESLQTKKVLEQKDLLSELFPDKKIILWDERLSSKGARAIQGKKARTEGSNEHSIAAALILQTYLQFLN